MKLNLGCGTDIIDGYVNIDIANPTNHPQLNTGDYRTLDSFDIKNDSIDEIRCIYGLQKIKFAELPQVLTNWVSKIKTGGEIIIQGIASDLLGHAMAYNYSSLQEINQLLFESGTLNVVTLDFLQNILNKLGTDVVEKQVNGVSYYIKCVKL